MTLSQKPAGERHKYLQHLAAATWACAKTPAVAHSWGYGRLQQDPSPEV